MPDLPNVGEDADEPPGGSGTGGRVAKEFQALGAHHEKLAEALVRMERQRYWLRFWACIAALVVVIGAALMEWAILCHIMSPYSETGDLFILLAVSPIIAITLITIFVLMGVFRGFHERDMEKFPTGALIQAASGNGP